MVGDIVATRRNAGFDSASLDVVVDGVDEFVAGRRDRDRLTAITASGPRVGDRVEVVVERSGFDAGRSKPRPARIRGGARPVQREGRRCEARRGGVAVSAVECRVRAAQGRPSSASLSAPLGRHTRSRTPTTEAAAAAAADRNGYRSLSQNPADRMTSGCRSMMRPRSTTLFAMREYSIGHGTKDRLLRRPRDRSRCDPEPSCPPPDARSGAAAVSPDLGEADATDSI